MNINQITLLSGPNQALFSHQPKYYLERFTKGQLLVVNVIFGFSNWKIKHIFLKQETISELAGVSLTTAKTTINLMEKFGMLMKLATPGRSNEYILHPYVYLKEFRIWASSILSSLRNKLYEMLASLKIFYYTQRSISNRAFNFNSNTDYDLRKDNINYNISLSSNIRKETFYVDSKLTYTSSFNKVKKVDKQKIGDINMLQEEKKDQKGEELDLDYIRDLPDKLKNKLKHVKNAEEMYAQYPTTANKRYLDQRLKEKQRLLILFAKYYPKTKNNTQGDKDDW